MVGDSNDKTNFPQKLLLTERQVSKVRKAFANGLSVTIKFSKTQLSMMVQLGGSIFNKVIGAFNTFNVLNSIHNSVELYIEEYVYPSGHTAKYKIVQLYPNGHSFFTAKYEI